MEVEPATDVLTAEEEYLLKVFRRYSSNTAASPATAAAASSTQRLQQSNNGKRSPSPPFPKTSPPSSTSVKFSAAGLGAVGKPSPVDSKPAGAAGAAQREESPGPVPTDTLSRAKMILEKKRKAAAAGLPRAGSAASSGAGGLRKAKITKVAGTPSSSARLDPVKVGEEYVQTVVSVYTCRAVTGGKGCAFRGGA